MDRFTPLAVCATLALDISLNNLFEQQDAQVNIVVLLTCLQVAMPLCTIVFIFVMFMRTRLLQLGNFGALYHKFRSLFLVSPVHLAFLLAFRGWRIEALARDTPWPLIWNVRGFYPVYITHKVVSVVFYLICYRTLLDLGDPSLYSQKVSPDSDKVPEFCRQLTAREFRTVPPLIKGSISFEKIKEAISVINQLVAEKYQLLAADVRELQALKVSEEALQLRKQWEEQEGADTYLTDCFASVDLTIYGTIDDNTAREVLQVLKHVNLITNLRSTRQYTLYGNENKDSRVQVWAKQALQKLRDAKVIGPHKTVGFSRTISSTNRM